MSFSVQGRRLATPRVSILVAAAMPVAVVAVVVVLVVVLVEVTI